jgi:hypothetical protein
MPAGQRLLHPIEGMYHQTLHGTEKPLRYDRMSGLDSEQLDELVWRIEEQLEEPWHKGIGRPKDLSLRAAVVVASGYMRQNIIQEIWAEIFDTSQPVIAGIIARFTPLIEASTEEERRTYQARQPWAWSLALGARGVTSLSWIGIPAITGISIHDHDRQRINACRELGGCDRWVG